MGMKTKLRVGSKIIERGKVHRVFKISKRKINGESERIIHFKPFYKNDTNRTLTCSIPESSFDETTMRKPASKEEVDSIIKLLSKGVRLRRPIDTNKAKDILKENDIWDTAQILRKFWHERRLREDGFTKTQKDVLEMALERVVQEVALVMGGSLTKAEEKITSVLGS